MGIFYSESNHKTVEQYYLLNHNLNVYKSNQQNITLCQGYKSIWHIDETQTSITTSNQSGSVTNGNKEVLPTPQISWTGASPSVLCHIQDTETEKFTPFI